MSLTDQVTSLIEALDKAKPGSVIALLLVPPDPKEAPKEPKPETVKARVMAVPRIGGFDGK